MMTTHAASPLAPPPNPPVLTKTASVPLPVTAPGKSATATVRTMPVAKSFVTVGAWRERAEDASQVTAALGSARTLFQGGVIAEGSSAFHLANPSFADESVTLNPRILPGAETRLFFESRLGYATANQFARVQVSTDGGVTWTSIWNRQGSGGAGDGGFQLETVSLAAYAGTTVRLRFLYEFTAGSAYSMVQTSPPVGWFLDDIQIGESFTERPYTATGDPTAQEIVLLELINRARADAAAEAVRLAGNTDPDVLHAMSYFSVDTALMTSQFATLTQSVQPLAMNARLLAAARLHSEDMLENVFQGHVSSSNPPAPNLSLDTVANRLARQGYDYSSTAENVYAFAKSAWHAHAGFNVDWGVNLGGMQDPPGHRLAIHNGIFREAGIGAVTGSKSNGTTTVGPLVVTQNFGVGPGGGQALITGVTYLDGDGDGFYDEGEGLGNVRVDVDGSSYYAFSSTHGAYTVPVPHDGSYQVSFRRTGFPVVRRSVSVAGGFNVKADYRGESVAVESVERLTPSSVRLNARQTGLVASLNLQVSADLVSWTNQPHVATPLPHGGLQIDTSVPSASAHRFFRITAEWPGP